MPVSDVWMTPAPGNVPKWWKISSGLVFIFVSVCSKVLLKVLNKTTVHKLPNLYNAIDKRPVGRPLITACNHYTCFDDPILASMLQWKHILNRDELRWLPGAKNVCFRSFRTSMFFQLGRVIPIVRGEGVYQFGMNFLVEKLNKGGWVQIYPEGKVNMTQEFMRLKWGIGRLVADSNVCPIVLLFWHIGMDSVLPNQKPYIPHFGKKLTVMFGEPINFENDLAALRCEEKSDNHMLLVHIGIASYMFDGLEMLHYKEEIRKHITDKIQEEFRKLKAATELQHFGRVIEDTKHDNKMSQR